MPDQYAARHRAPGRHQAPKQHTPRLTAGVALPTAAAAALTFTATGAAVATNAKPRAVSFDQNAALVHQAHGQAEAQSTYRQEVVERHQTALADTGPAAARREAADRAARAQARQALAVKRAAAELARAHRWVMPISGASMSSNFGWRWGRMHEGDDFAAPVGTDLVAMSTGEVVFAGVESGFGTIVKVRYWDGTESWYGHMSAVGVSVGDHVSPGDVVGQSGNTGHSTGPHLHLEIHPDGGDAVDPLPWLRAHGLLP